MTLRHILFNTFCTASVALSAAFAAPAIAEPIPDVPGFYDQPAPLPNGGPGDPIRSEPAPLPGPFAALAGSATRIMFHTNDTHGDPAVSTGLVLKSTVAWTGPGPQPLIGYLPGVQGQGRQCAPSLLIPEVVHYSAPLDVMAEYELPFQLALLAQGYNLVIPDYPGLGTTADPAVLDPVAEAHTALDAVRAAQRLGDPAIPERGPVVFTGYSQGGSAAAGVAEQRPGYAPELNIQGVVAGSVPTDIRGLLTYGENGALSAVVGYVLNVLTAYSPEAAQAISEIVNTAGRAMASDVAHQCAAESILRYGFQSSEQWTSSGKPISQALDEDPVIHDILDRMTLGNRTPTIPTLLITGDNDDVPAQPVRDLAARWCGSGAAVQLTQTRIPTLAPGTAIGHSLNLITTFPTTILGWIHDRFTGAPAPTNCT